MKVNVNSEICFYGNGSAGSSQPEPHRPRLLFVHGAGMDHSVWLMPARHFARIGFDVIAPDLPGHGRSAGQALTSIDAIAQWLTALLDALGGGASAVVGHSMGSLAAFTWAAGNADRCSALGLLGTSAPMPVGPPLLEAARDNHHAAIDMANQWSHSAQGRLGGNDNPGVWMLGAGERLIERSRPGVFHADLAACNGFAASGRTVAQTVPTLVVAGESDQMTPLKAGVAVAEAIGHARRVVLPGCGHSMLSEQPNQVLDALRTLLLFDAGLLPDAVM